MSARPPLFERQVHQGTAALVRPHDISVVPAGSGDLDALVDVVEPRGSELLIYLRLGPAGNGDDNMGFASHCSQAGPDADHSAWHVPPRI